MKFYQFTTFTISGEKYLRAPKARAKILVFFMKKVKILFIFCRNLPEFERKYSFAVPLGAAGAKNYEFWPYRSQNPAL